MYKVEFVRWIEEDPEPQVVARIDAVFATEEEAFARASGLMPGWQREGATAFRVFEQGERAMPLPKGAYVVAKE